MTEQSKTGRRRVRLSLAADPGKSVSVAGTFNDWNSTARPMKYKDGTYSATLLLEPGTYQYKFIIDGQWCIDPECLSWTRNEHGTLNSLITVS